MNLLQYIKLKNNKFVFRSKISQWILFLENVVVTSGSLLLQQQHFEETSVWTTAHMLCYHL